MTTKPEIEFPDGPAPTELVIKDLVVGDGAEAVPGGTVEVHYVGVEYDTGEEFDSSWNRGESIEFPLRGLIQGWQDGIPGMKVGGRRQLIIPPEQAYGPAGRRAPAVGQDSDLRHRPARHPLALGRTFLTARNFAEISSGKERSRGLAGLPRAGQPQQQPRAAQRAVLQRGCAAV